MLVDWGRGTEVEVFEAGDGEAEVDEGVVGGIEAREDRVVVVYPALCVIGGVGVSPSLSQYLVSFGYRYEVSFLLSFFPSSLLGFSLHRAGFSWLLSIWP